MSRRKLLVKRQFVEYGGVPQAPGERVKSTRPGPKGQPPSNQIITEPMSARKRELWVRWATEK